MGAHRADMGQAQMAPVGFQAHGAGGDGVAVGVAALLLPSGKADPAALQLASTGLLPPPVAVDGAFDPIVERFFGHFPPPRCTGLGVDALDVLGLVVPPLAQPVKRRRRGRLAGRVEPVDVGLDRLPCPVERLTARPEMAGESPVPVGGGVERETERLQRPTLRRRESSSGHGDILPGGCVR